MFHNFFGRGVTDAYAAAGWKLEACDQMKKRTLAATEGTDDGNELAGATVEIQMSNGFHDHTSARNTIARDRDFYAYAAHINDPSIWPVNRSRFTRRSPVETFHDLSVLFL